MRKPALGSLYFQDKVAHSRATFTARSYLHNAPESIFRARERAQHIRTRPLHLGEVWSGGKLNRPDAEALQIADVHFATSVLQDERTIRHGGDVVRAKSALHRP